MIAYAWYYHLFDLETVVGVGWLVRGFAAKQGQRLYRPSSMTPAHVATQHAHVGPSQC